MFGCPAAAVSVGNQSSPEKIPFSTEPGLMWPGQRIMAGTRKPPSKLVPLVALNGVMPPSGQVKTSAPLSVVKMTMVLLVSPMSSICLSKAPTLSSSCAMPASSRPKLVWLFCNALYFLDRNVQTCMRVVLCQTKNGLPSRFALSMKSVDDLTNTPSNVVLSYFPFRNGRSCIFGTFDMSGNGGSGPSSTIRCLPILPQRGISVGSSVSVAWLGIRLRGRYLL